MQLKCFPQCLLPPPPIIYFSSKCLPINPDLPACSVKSCYPRNEAVLDMGFSVLLVLQLCFLSLLALLGLVHFNEEVNANSYSQGLL